MLKISLIAPPMASPVVQTIAVFFARANVLLLLIVGTLSHVFEKPVWADSYLHVCSNSNSDRWGSGMNGLQDKYVASASTKLNSVVKVPIMSVTDTNTGQSKWSESNSL